MKTSFGRAERLGKLTTLDDPISKTMSEEERGRYTYPQVRVIPAGGPYFKFPWQKIHKISIATQTVNIGLRSGRPARQSRWKRTGSRDQGSVEHRLRGAASFSVSEKNLYAFLFGVENPVAHVMGYFISVLRERIATFEAPRESRSEEALDLETLASAQGISINDLRRICSDINDHMDRECVDRRPGTGSRWIHRSSPALTRRPRWNQRWRPSIPRTIRSLRISVWRRRLPTRRSSIKAGGGDRDAQGAG